MTEDRGQRTEDGGEDVGRRAEISMMELLVSVAVMVFVASCAGTLVGIYGLRVARVVMRWLQG